MSSVSRYDDADIVIVDGRNTVFRASYANAGLGFMSEAGWQPTGGVYGFLESVLVLAHRAKNASIVIAWEGSKDNRREIVEGYKVRKPDAKQEELVRVVLKQEGILKGILRSSGWDSVRSSEWEADDAIGTVATAGLKQGLNVAIYSTDADMLQLLAEPGEACVKCGSKEVEEVGESGEFWVTCRDCGRDDVGNKSWIRQVKPLKGMNVVWTSDTVRAEWLVPPRLVPDVKALAGDTSDNYKGCPGIGDGWARKIVSTHGAIEQVFEAALSGEVCGSEKKAEAILANRTEIEACLRVARINTKAPVRYKRGEADRPELTTAIKQLRFHSLRSEHHTRRMLK